MIALILRPIMATFGVLLILLGIPITPLPIPLGLPMIITGTFLLMHSVPRFRRAVMAWLHNHPRVHARVRAVQRRTRRSRKSSSENQAAK